MFGNFFYKPLRFEHGLTRKNDDENGEETNSDNEEKSDDDKGYERGNAKEM